MGERADRLSSYRCHHEATKVGRLDTPPGQAPGRMLFNTRWFVSALGGRRQSIRPIPHRRRLGRKQRQLAMALGDALLPLVLQGLLADWLLSEVWQNWAVCSQVLPRAEKLSRSVHLPAVEGTWAWSKGLGLRARSRLSAPNCRAWEYARPKHWQNQMGIR